LSAPNVNCRTFFKCTSSGRARSFVSGFGVAVTGTGFFAGAGGQQAPRTKDDNSQSAPFMVRESNTRL
jgi:hypothetical protein